MEAAATTIIHKRPILTRNTLSQKYLGKLIEISPHFWWQVQTSLAKKKLTLRQLTPVQNHYRDQVKPHNIKE